LAIDKRIRLNPKRFNIRLGRSSSPWYRL
jgi:hypothetical protein